MERQKILKKREKDKKYYSNNRKKILKKQSIYQKEKRKDIALPKEELQKMNRDEFGRFKKTTGSTKYKMQQRNGVRKGVHVIAWEYHNKKDLPSGWCVHHINENKRDNRIENLIAMKIGEHSKMHFKNYYKENDIWNKGKSTHHGNNVFGHKVTEKQKKKCRTSWLLKNLDRNISIWKLRDSGLKKAEISKRLNITIDKVNSGYRSISKTFDTNSGRLL